jgi:hypothetical protein
MKFSNIIIQIFGWILEIMSMGRRFTSEVNGSIGIRLSIRVPFLP